jgi:hypothetical protein
MSEQWRRRICQYAKLDLGFFLIGGEHARSAIRTEATSRIFHRVALLAKALAGQTPK